MDWTNLTADKNVWLNKHYTPQTGWEPPSVPALWALA